MKEKNKNNNWMIFIVLVGLSIMGFLLLNLYNANTLLHSDLKNLDANKIGRSDVGLQCIRNQTIPMPNGTMQASKLLYPYSDFMLLYADHIRFRYFNVSDAIEGNEFYWQTQNIISKYDNLPLNKVFNISCKAVGFGFPLDEFSQDYNWTLISENQKKCISAFGSPICLSCNWTARTYDLKPIDKCAESMLVVKN